MRNFLSKHFAGLLMAALAISVLALPACSTSPPGTSPSAAVLSPAKQITVSIAAVTGVRVAADQLLQVKKITVAQAQDVQARCDVARQTLDLARVLLNTDTSTAVAKLNAATVMLADLNEFLIARGSGT